MSSYRSIKKGSGLVEVVIGASIILIIVTSLLSGYFLYIRQGLANVDRVQAALLAEEGIEIIKYLRDASWSANMSTLNPNSTYSLGWSDNTWKSTTTQRFIDSKFVRTFTAASVSRDTSSNIVTSGGTNDPGARLVTVSISWHAPSGTTTKQISAYIFDLYSN